MSTTALLLIDLQNDYFNSYSGAKYPLFNTEKAAENALALLTQFRHNKMPIIHVRHEFPTTDAPFFLPNSEGAKIHASLTPNSGENVVLKHHINSFKETNLKAILDKNKITNLVIVGAMSHMCIDAVTRAAADFGYQCKIADDACTTRDLEFNGVNVSATQVHAAYMAALDFAYGDVMTTAALIKELTSL